MIPLDPNSMLCRCCYLCSLRNRRISCVERRNSSKTLENRILLPSVSNFCSPFGDDASSPWRQILSRIHFSQNDQYALTSENGTSEVSLTTSFVEARNKAPLFCVKHITSTRTFGLFRASGSRPLRRTLRALYKVLCLNLFVNWS